MRVLAARFGNRRTASAALRAIRDRLRLDIEDAAIAPLGWPGRADADEETVLAGRFQEHHTAGVRDVVSQHGGIIVADVDELWTRPRIPQADEPAAVDQSASQRDATTRRQVSAERERQAVA